MRRANTQHEMNKYMKRVKRGVKEMKYNRRVRGGRATRGGRNIDLYYFDHHCCCNLGEKFSLIRTRKTSMI